MSATFSAVLKADVYIVSDYIAKVVFYLLIMPFLIYLMLFLGITFKIMDLLLNMEFTLEEFIFMAKIAKNLFFSQMIIITIFLLYVNYAFLYSSKYVVHKENEKEKQ